MFDEEEDDLQSFVLDLVTSVRLKRDQDQYQDQEVTTIHPIRHNRDR